MSVNLLGECHAFLCTFIFFESSLGKELSDQPQQFPLSHVKQAIVVAKHQLGVVLCDPFLCLCLRPFFHHRKLGSADRSDGSVAMDASA